jgi:hypothetical protein
MSTAPNDDQPSSVIALPAAASAADYVSQATTIEQSRAVAQVQAAVIMAKRMPRVQANCIAAMKETCAVMELAETAFFRYSRSGSQITGASVHLARELARCWENIEYGMVELERDTRNEQSTMLAFAWDLQTNTRATTTFIVPWLRDKQSKDGKPSPLTAIRDIYENNANMGARRVREMIFGVLPKWFTAQGQAACRHTIEHGSTKPLPQRVAEALKAFEGLGVHADQLGTKLGRDAGHWGAGDVATLIVIFKSINAGETTVEDEFPAADRKVTMAELAGHRTSSPSPQAQGKPVSVATDALEKGLLPKTGQAKPEPTPAADDGEQGMRPDDPDLGAQ